MMPSQRQQAIIDELRLNGLVCNADLATRFGVSEDSIRRDMRLLAKSGMISRTYGGAKWVDDQEVKMGLDDDPLLAVKRAIAHRALDYLRPGETIALDIGSTVAQFARALATSTRATSTIVITNDLRTAAILARFPNVEVNITGGVIRQQHHLFGPLTRRVLSILYFDTLFLGTSGLTLEEGLTDPSPEAAEIKQALLQKAKRTILLVDHTKFGRRYMAKVAGIEQVETIITDGETPQVFIDGLLHRGVRCVVV